MPDSPRDPDPGSTQGRPVVVIVHDCNAPQPDAASTPRTKGTVQLTVSLKAHPDDVAAVIKRLQAAIKDAATDTGGRIDIEFAMPEIVRE
jgi:hypothetical protein